MAIGVLLLSIVLMCLVAYTVAIERTLHTLGMLGTRDGEERRVTRARASIILGVYLARLNPTFLLAIVVYLIIARASAWYYGILLLILCGIGSVLIGAITCLHCGSREILAILLADLERRCASYRIACDTLRLHAVEDLLARIRSLLRMPEERERNP